jgi:hypothetical protein
MAKYALTPYVEVIMRTTDMAFIPNDPANSDCADYLAWKAAGGVPDPYVPPVQPQTVLSQDLMAQFTAADAVAIQTAIAGSQPFWLLWYQLQAQKDPMVVTNARFLAGWNALIQVLGQARMTAIATALGVTIV